MNSSIRVAATGMLFAAALAVSASAQDTASGVVDRGRFITYRGDTPIATERFQFERQGDSVIVSANSERRRRQPDGSEKRYTKTMSLSARADDFGMLNYTSSEAVDGQTMVRSIVPGDTMLTVFSEIKGGSGGAEMLERPPGRFFAMDEGLFTLFDVIGRNLQHRIYGSRPVQLVVFGKTTTAVQATATLAGADTVNWGGRPVVTQRIALRDSTTEFQMWLSPEGHMLRLEGANGRLVVVREPPPLPPPAKRKHPRGK